MIKETVSIFGLHFLALLFGLFFVATFTAVFGALIKAKKRIKDVKGIPKIYYNSWLIIFIIVGIFFVETEIKYLYKIIFSDFLIENQFFTINTLLFFLLSIIISIIVYRVIFLEKIPKFFYGSSLVFFIFSAISLVSFYAYFREIEILKHMYLFELMISSALISRLFGKRFLDFFYPYLSVAKRG